MSIRNLDSLFDPASVAVFGASQRPGSVGATVWKNLRSSNFKGALYAVNPKHKATMRKNQDKKKEALNQALDALIEQTGHSPEVILGGWRRAGADDQGIGRAGARRGVGPPSQ